MYTENPRISQIFFCFSTPLQESIDKTERENPKRNVAKLYYSNDLFSSEVESYEFINVSCARWRCQTFPFLLPFYAICKMQKKMPNQPKTNQNLTKRRRTELISYAPAPNKSNKMSHKHIKPMWNATYEIVENMNMTNTT